MYFLKRNNVGRKTMTLPMKDPLLTLTGVTDGSRQWRDAEISGNLMLASVYMSCDMWYYVIVIISKGNVKMEHMSWPLKSNWREQKIKAAFSTVNIIKPEYCWISIECSSQIESVCSLANGYTDYIFTVTHRSLNWPLTTKQCNGELYNLEFVIIVNLTVNSACFYSSR